MDHKLLTCAFGTTSMVNMESDIKYVNMVSKSESDMVYPNFLY